MAERKQGRSGWIVFASFAVLLAGAIGATVLLANDYRNLNRLLARFGLPPVAASSARHEPRPYELRGPRMPRPTGLVPGGLIGPVEPLPRGRFVRTIRRSPEALCAALGESGFDNPGWRAGGLGGQNWECHSYREFSREEAQEGTPSSVFLAIRGNAETRVSSFRIKLNIEDPATEGAVIAAAIAAIGVFFEEVRWEEAPEILADLGALREFDLVRFGNRIQLKKEFSETPRYNFLVTPDRSRDRRSYLPDYFDRGRWLPLPEALR